MPVIEVSALPQREGIDVRAASAALTKAVAALLGEEPRGTWVVWRTIEPGRYVEGGDAPAVQPPATHPPLVQVVASEGRSPELVERILVAVAETLARELRLEPGNVFVRWVEATAGRVYSGGRVAGTA
jgi:phenylpyruvate tautomerase PptA (4-oxalocrotonate tautomerase family)